MNKHYSLAFAVVLVAGSAMAQSGSTNSHPALKQGYAESKNHQVTGAKGAVIWSNTFANASDWDLALVPGAFPDVEWEIGIGLVNTGGFTTPAITSTTASDGYAMVDSDAGNNSGTQYESCHMTNAVPIDLSLYPNVVIQFENQYRKFTDEQCYLVVSTNNTDWPTNLDPTTDISGMPNVFYVWQPTGELVQGVSPGNPSVKRINISSVAGGQGTVWVRFWWTGIWGYSWFVDDVHIEEQAQFDIAMENGFVSHTFDGNEYGRIPNTQLGANMNIGGDYTNFGVQDQTNVVVTGDAVAFSASTNSPIVVSDETFLMDESVALPALANGPYTCTFSVTSDQIGSDGFPGNNSFLRNFEVTEFEYSLDGIGNHPPGYEALTATGTNSFTGNADGIFLFTYYPIEADLTVYGLEVQLANATVAGGLVIASVHDTLEVLGDNISSPLGQSADYFITAADVTAGKATILMNPALTLSTGGYYAGVELYSNANANDIRVLDDITVPQPVLASMIHLTSDGTTYTNGNAYAIRLISDPSIGISEQDELQGISVSPNPSADLITITAATPQQYFVEVLNTVGQTILRNGFNMSTTMDLGNLAKGVYSVRISTDKASTVKPVMIY